MVNKLTCQKCADYQDGHLESGDGGGGISYYRVDVANVQITGCSEHVATVMKTLNKYREEHDGKLAESEHGEIR